VPKKIVQNLKAKVLKVNNYMLIITKSYEKILSIPGHIFAEKRRKLTIRTFSDLVVIKIKRETFEQKLFLS
jgi:hypothetical protein